MKMFALDLGCHKDPPKRDPVPDFGRSASIGRSSEIFAERDSFGKDRDRAIDMVGGAETSH